MERRYTMVSYASQKDGTSVAARQPETDFSAEFVFVSACSSASASPPPSTAQPLRTRPFRGRNGTPGTETIGSTFMTGIGIASAATVPRSGARQHRGRPYPAAGRSLHGTWHTDIASGVCRGSVMWPVAAYPPAGVTVGSASVTPRSANAQEERSWPGARRGGVSTAVPLGAEWHAPAPDCPPRQPALFCVPDAVEHLVFETVYAAVDSRTMAGTASMMAGSCEATIG